ncbi:MAG: helix-turn-helix domain-containing protein [Pseudoflavonifractor sp.]
MSNDRYEVCASKIGPMSRTSGRLLYVSTAKYGGDWHSTLHTHTCTEIFYVVGGSGRFKIEELTLSVAADDMIIVNPNVEHTEVSLNSSPLEYIVMGVEGLEFAGGREVDSRYCAANLGNGREDMLHYLRSLLGEIETKASGYEIVCQDILEVLLIRLIRRTDLAIAPAAPCPRSTKECGTVRRYMDSHFKENITLDQLAALTHVNKYYMVHAFSKEYGISPINYLITRRIEESRVLLCDTDHSLSQIAHMLGFSSPSYFSQSFRRLEGMSPMEYRKGKKNN